LTSAAPAALTGPNLARTSKTRQFRPLARHDRSQSNRDASGGAPIASRSSARHLTKRWALGTQGALRGARCSRTAGNDSSIRSSRGSEQTVARRSGFMWAVVGGVVLVVAAALTLAPRHEASSESVATTSLGFSELPDGRGGTNVEAVVYTEEMGFDKERSLTRSRPLSIRCSARTAPGATARKGRTQVPRRLQFTRASI
jgi:hypothetical protein